MRSLYERFPAGDPDQQLDIPVAPTFKRPSFAEQLKHAKATGFILLLSLLVGGLTYLGENLRHHQPG